MVNDFGALAISIAMNPDANYHAEGFHADHRARDACRPFWWSSPSVPANTLAEFVALAKSKPGGMSFGSAGFRLDPSAHDGHLRAAAGIELLHVPYRGGTGLVNALLTGEVDAGWSGIPNVLSLIADRANCARSA